MSDERLAEIRGRLGVLMPHASKLGVQAMADDMQYLLGRLAAAEARAERVRRQRDRLLAEITDGGYCKLCDGFGDDGDQITHCEDCPTRFAYAAVPTDRPAVKGGGDAGTDR